MNNLRAPRPTALIDLAGLGLDTIESTPRGIRIGAAVTFQQLLEHGGTPWFLRAAAGLMANRNIRNRATVGGHLGANRSCADLIPTLLAAEAQVSLTDGEVPVEQVVEGAPELMLSVFVPATARTFGLENHSRTASDLSIVSAAASFTLDGERLRRPILAIGGVARHVVRLHEVEQALEGHPLPPPERVEPLIAAAVRPIDDLRGSAAYKRHLAAVLGGRALRAALHRLVSGEGGH